MASRRRADNKSLATGDQAIAMVAPLDPGSPGDPGATVFTDAPADAGATETSTESRRRRPPKLVRAPRRRRFSLLTRRDKTVLGLMVGIPLALDLIFIWGPCIASIALSFTNWNGIGAITDKNWVGPLEYQKLWAYPGFIGALQHNLLWLAFLMFVATPLGILLAVILDGELKGSRIYQTIFYTPVVLSLAVIGMIWQLQYAPDIGQGFINSALSGIPRVPFLSFMPDVAHTDWLGDGNINLFAALVAASWRHVGYVCILYLAGLKSFDPQLREAASMDGANERQTFFHIVLPVMRPINIVVVVITTIEALRAFDIAYLINGGRNGLDLLSTLITNTALSESGRVGFGSAVAVVLLVISLVPIITFLYWQMKGDQQ